MKSNSISYSWTSSSSSSSRSRITTDNFFFSNGTSAASSRCSFSELQPKNQESFQQHYITTKNTEHEIPQNNISILKKFNSPLLSTNSTEKVQSGKQVTVSEFEKEFRDEHNRLRAIHGCPPLKLDRKLCDLAAEWARYLASQNTLQHRNNSNYGENLYMTSGVSIKNGKKAVEAWYSEIKDYNFNRGDFSTRTGHFTQVIWRNSTALGVAFETRGSSTWVVANYNPPGNVQGQYRDNVPIPKK